MEHFRFEAPDMQDRLRGLLVVMGIPFQEEGACLVTDRELSGVVEALRSAVREHRLRDGWIFPLDEQVHGGGRGGDAPGVPERAWDSL